MTEELVTLETAMLAKEKGFDEPCRHGYDDDHSISCKCPTQDLLERWLRERHGYRPVAMWFRGEDASVRWGYEISIINQIEHLHYTAPEDDGFATHELAREAALQHALKLLP